MGWTVRADVQPEPVQSGQASRPDQIRGEAGHAARRVRLNPHPSRPLDPVRPARPRREPPALRELPHGRRRTNGLAARRSVTVEDEHVEKIGEMMADALATANAHLSAANIQLRTHRVSDHTGMGMGVCQTLILKDGNFPNPDYPVCGDAWVPWPDLGADPLREVNIHVLKVAGPTAFAFDPCFFPPGEPAASSPTMMCIAVWTSAGKECMDG